MSNKPGGIAARAGRWSARHKKTAILGWLAFVIVALIAGNLAGTKEPSDADQYDGESRAAAKLVEDAGFSEAAGEMVLVQSKTLTAKDGAFRAAVKDVEHAVGGQSVVTNVVSPYSKDGVVSEDGHSALVQFDIKGDAEKAEDKIDPVVAAVDKVAASHSDLSIGEFGSASVNKELAESQKAEQSRSQMISLSVTLLILLITFGALLAAAVPVVLSLTAVMGTMGLVALASQLVPTDSVTMQVVLLVGLAVGVDYSLFYIRREREERAKGRDKLDALDMAAATSGRAVLISGMTVIIAMAGMFLTGNTTFMGMGLGTILVVAVAVLGSLTVLPAILAAFGDRINKGRIPLLRRRSEARDSRAWGWLVERVMRRPVVAIVLAGGLLVALSIPAFGMQTKLSGTEDLPKDLATVQTYHKVQAAFPSEAAPATVVVKAADLDAPQVKQAIAGFQKAIQKDDMFPGTIAVDVNDANTVAQLNVGLAGSGSGDAATKAVEHLRDDVLPATLDRTPGITAEVGGQAAAEHDFNTLMKTKTPIVFAFVLGLAFLLLLVTFRSIVIPIKAIVLNLLSVGAAYGLLTIVFQDGKGESLLGFESNGAIASWLPLFLFVILFGLSMDYHVFILSRVREAWQRGMSTEKAVAHGIKTTAGTVTAAAMVMVLVFAAFATESGLEMKQLGVGLAAAILIDATIIRGVLLPATMKLLGRWNWYLPRWLQWLPEFDHEGGTREPRLGRGLPEPAAA
ncbi:MAG TPA: MMPL family transporter [Solirubrobacteraceae bacterium]|nr:MMPL family transporter [Solirubrobacteraceae bacterium]